MSVFQACSSGRVVLYHLGTVLDTARIETLTRERTVLDGPAPRPRRRTQTAGGSPGERRVCDRPGPHGTLPRLLLAWVCTEAVRRQSPELILGDSLSEFMRKVGIYSTSGDKHTRLRNQMRRLFGCTVSLLYEDARGEATLNAPIARLTEFWWSDRQPDARSLRPASRSRAIVRALSSCRKPEPNCRHVDRLHRR